MVLAYQLTFHPVPFFKSTIGYFPKGPMLNKLMVESLSKVGEEKKAAFIKIEPNVEKTKDKRLKTKDSIGELGLVPAKKSLFTKFNFVIDLTKDEQGLLSAMQQKTRYNIKVAQKKGVEVYESTKKEDFEVYLKLYFETTRRQKYFGHTEAYHRKVWETLMPAGLARVLVAKYRKKPLVAWMLLNFKDTLYYPYGGSSMENREVMASNLIAWEAIRLGKRMGLKFFDMWGALEPDANEKNPWFGFHRFKAGYGPAHVEYIGTYDLVLKPSMYNLLNVGEKLRWLVLRASRR